MTVRPPSVAVVGRPQLAQALVREWKAHTGQDLDVQAWDEGRFQELLAHGDWPSPPLDGVIYPRKYFGTLAAQDRILPAPGFVSLGADADLLSEADFFPVLRAGVMDRRNAMLAIPISSEPFLLLYDPRPFQDQKLSLPATWTDLSKVAQALADGRTKTSAAPRVRVLAQPLAPQWAYRTLLQRAAAYVRDPRRVSDLFELGTMRPLIAEPPYVQALQELVEDEWRFGDPTQFWDAGQIWQAMRSRGVTLGLGGWPHLEREGARSTEADGEVVPIFASWVPGARKLYSFAEAEWESRPEVVQPTLLGGGEYVASVLRGTRKQRATWNLLLRVAGKELGGRIVATGTAGGPARQSQLSHLHLWFDPEFGVVASESLRIALRNQLSQNLILTAPRVSHAWEYISLLDRAVQSAVLREMTPKQALDQVAQAWEDLLRLHGQEAQQQAHFGQVSAP